LRDSCSFPKSSLRLIEIAGGFIAPRIPCNDLRVRIWKLSRGPFELLNFSLRRSLARLVRPIKIHSLIDEQLRRVRLARLQFLVRGFRLLPIAFHETVNHVELRILITSG